MDKRFRLWVQAGWTALTNGYASGFLEGKIYKGASKVLCVPGLNCYSCPGALASCPIGSLQAVMGGAGFQFSCYVFGFLMVFGSLMGRFICGWLCPFGLVQDLLYKIPLFKKRKNLPGHRILKNVKYMVFLLFVILLPITVVNVVGMGQPWFCQYICPSGTLFGGFPLLARNESLRSAIGWLFGWKTFILAAVVFCSVKIYRPFCQYLCPLGAFYGLFNPISLYRYRVDEKECVSCGLCRSACPVNIKVWENPNTAECIRCGQCKSACPHGAIYDTVEAVRKRRACPQTGTQKMGGN